MIKLFFIFTSLSLIALSAGYLIYGGYPKVVEPPEVVQESPPPESETPTNTESQKPKVARKPIPQPAPTPIPTPTPAPAPTPTPPSIIIQVITPPEDMKKEKTTPAPESTTPPAAETPTYTEVKFEELAKSNVSNIGNDYVQFSVYSGKKDDVIKLTLNDETHTKVVTKDAGPSEMFEIRGLEPAITYDYEIRVERGYQYAVRVGEFRTTNE